MADYGGRRPGAGRPKGSRNKKTLEQVKAVEETGKTPLEYLLEIMRDKNRDADQRIDAAKAAAPYIHPRLTATTVSGDEDKPLRHEFKWADED